LEYTIRKVKENQERMKQNGIHPLLVYADNVNLLGENINTIKKNTDALLDVSEEAGKHMLCINTRMGKITTYR
jgi:hypothetical protein